MSTYISFELLYTPQNITYFPSPEYFLPISGDRKGIAFWGIPEVQCTMNSYHALRMSHFSRPSRGHDTVIAPHECISSSLVHRIDTLKGVMNN